LGRKKYRTGGSRKRGREKRLRRRPKNFGKAFIEAGIDTKEVEEKRSEREKKKAEEIARIKKRIEREKKQKKKSKTAQAVGSAEQGRLKQNRVAQIPSCMKKKKP